jgi:hypothetical protein
LVTAKEFDDAELVAQPAPATRTTLASAIDAAD